MTRDDFTKKWFAEWDGVEISFRELLNKIFAVEIAPRDERIAEKDRTIALRDEQIRYQHGEIKRQDAYIEGLEADLRKLKEGWKTVEHTCFTCGGRLVVHESHYCPKCDRGMADVPKEVSKSESMPPIPDETNDFYLSKVRACIIALYKHAGIK